MATQKQDRDNAGQQRRGSSPEIDKQLDQQVDRKRDPVKDTALSEDDAVDGHEDVGSKAGTGI